MNELTQTYTEQLPMVYDPEESSVFTNLAIKILGDSVLEKQVKVYTDESLGELFPNETRVETYVIKERCSNMVASTSWSIFLFCSLLLFGLIRSLFNAFSRGD